MHVGAARGPASAFVRTRGSEPLRRGSSAPAASAGERVRAERDDLEPGVPEHAVERLLAGIAGAAEDGGALHRENYTDRCKLCK